MNADAMTTAAPASVRFDESDLDLFAAASHDVNPLHRSAAYARRTAFGERVVFGALGTLRALGHLRPRPGQALSKLSVEFVGPMFVGVGYVVDVAELSPERAKVKLRDGRRVVLRLTAHFRSGEVAATPAWTESFAARAESADHADDALVAGLALHGRYAARSAALATLMVRHALAARGVGPRHVETLLLASYLVGMELPGRRALFSDLAMDFDADVSASAAPLEWSLRLDAMHAEFGMLSLSLATSVAGVLSARGKLTAFARQELSPAPMDAVEAAVGRSDRLRGQVALVTGASRGLGAAIAHALALHGCTVIGTYLSSVSEAHALAARLTGTPGRFVPLHGDAGDPVWAAAARAMIVAEHGRLDLLVCNACPALRPLWLEPASALRITEHVARSVAMVAVPLSYFLDLVAAQRGTAVVMSSSAVLDPPAEWPHYVAAKCAVEALARVAAAEQPAARVRVVRPPKLLTELVNTPLGRQDALAPEEYAARLVRRLLDPGEIPVDGVMDLG